MRRILILMWLILMAAPVQFSHAQGANLLQNSSFDNGLTPIAGGAVPASWGLWGNPDSSDKEELGALTHSQPWSWRLRKEYGTFTGGGYQTVGGILSGATYRFSVYAMIWTCNDEVYACRTGEGTYSDTWSGGRVRVGIDPTGGTDPYSGNIRWSGFISPFTWGSFQSVSVDARATGTTITVFMYYTADQGTRFQDVFWDDAALVKIADPPPPATPRPTSPPVTYAPIATSAIQTDGAVIHTVKAGESLWAISQAYGVSLDSLRQLNGLSDGSVIHPGDQIIVALAPTATAGPSQTPTLAATATSFEQATRIAQDLTPTIAVINVGQPASSTTNGDDSLFRSGVIALAIVVVIIGVVGVGGILWIIGSTITRPRI